jgi:3-phytase
VEVTANGTLVSIPGGIQPTIDDYDVYGSCIYRSKTSGRQYLFVNAKTAQYLQYELTATADGTLVTTLVRTFTGGNGGQVEGCQTDEDNGWIFLGEEPYGLWRYNAEPDSDPTPILIDSIDGNIFADVEGVTLIPEHNPNEGYILISCQGVSAYNIYKRAAPHEYVATFTVTKSADGSVDAVSNTDGLSAVGTSLGPDFPRGLVVVHDDTNELPGGGAAAEASFKLISLEKILAAEPIKGLNLMDQVDNAWNPRA